MPSGLLALDPGGTTGWAFFKDGHPRAAGQVPGNGEAVEALIDAKQPSLVVIEEYVLYPWALKSQTWSDCPEAQLIGVIRFLCRKRSIPVLFQGANQAKAFSTDKRLKQWGFLLANKPHANDAIRHGIYYVFFGRKGKATPQPQCGYR
jgi:hypothetical protein